MIPGLTDFLRDYPGMNLLPIVGQELIIEGNFEFSASAVNRSEIADSYELRITVPECFPAGLPVVVELANKIPRNGKFHVNPDRSLCLGSPLRLLLKISKDPTLSGFASSCLVPYLYAISHKLRFGGEFPFSELKHGAPGQLEDYMEIFSLTRPEQAHRAIQLLGMKKRLANKLPCPCGCGNRLGRCPFNRKLLKYRALASRSWFRSHA